MSRYLHKITGNRAILTADGLQRPGAEFWSEEEELEGCTCIKAELTEEELIAEELAAVPVEKEEIPSDPTPDEPTTLDLEAELPEGYEEMNAREACTLIRELEDDDDLESILAIVAYEESHADRSSVLKVAVSKIKNLTEG
jgi:hypothetical protein